MCVHIELRDRAIHLRGQVRSNTLNLSLAKKLRERLAVILHTPRQVDRPRTRFRARTFLCEQALKTLLSTENDFDLVSMEVCGSLWLNNNNRTGRYFEVKPR